jgi:phosphatidylinositol alpha-1,6-mannosyltransferase
VLIVSTEFPPGPGGIGTHAFELARNLAERDWKVSVLAAQDYASPDEVSAFNAGQTFVVHSWRRLPIGSLRGVWRLAALLSRMRRDKPQVVVASGSRAVLLTAVACRGSRAPWLAVGHGTEFGRSTGWFAAALRRSFDQATAVVCVSEYTRGLMQECGVRPREEAVIPNGADPNRFRLLPAQAVRDARIDLGLPEGRLLVSVGHVTERKGQDVVVRALPRILEDAPDVRYLVVGLPTLAEELRRLARSLGVEDRLRILGRVDDERLVAILNAADVFVATSRRTGAGDVEGFGIAVVEAALCGKPAIVSADSGLAEAIREGVTGVGVPPDDPGATASAVLGLLQNETRRRSMGESARARALSEQTWASRIDEYDRLLRRISGGGLPVRISSRAAV